MNAPYRPTHQSNLDHEFAQAIQSLRQHGERNFTQDLDEVKKLSAALVSWNDALMQELDRATSLCAQSREQLLSKILSATPAVAPDAGYIPDVAPSAANHEPGLEALVRHFASPPSAGRQQSRS